MSTLQERVAAHKAPLDGREQNSADKVLVCARERRMEKRACEVEARQKGRDAVCKESHRLALARTPDFASSAASHSHKGPSNDC